MMNSTTVKMDENDEFNVEMTFVRGMKYEGIVSFDKC